MTHAKCKIGFCACGNRADKWIRGGWACDRCLKFEEAYYGDETDGRKLGKPPAPWQKYKSVPKQDRQPKPGEITLKEWFFQEAQRLAVAVHIVQYRFYRNGYPNLKTRKVTNRTIFVCPNR